MWGACVAVACRVVAVARDARLGTVATPVTVTMLAPAPGVVLSRPERAGGVAV